MIAGAVLAAVILGGPPLGPPRPPCGCSPSVTGNDRMTMVDKAERYHAVFIGFVARVDTVPINPGMPRPPDQATNWKRYHVAVVRAWIPPASDTALFRGGLEVMSSCDPPLRFGRTYLFFADKSYDRAYYNVNHCMVAEIDRVTDVVDSLDRRRWPKPDN